MSFAQAVPGSNLRGLLERRSASRKMVCLCRNICVGETSQGDSLVVEGDAASDLPLGGSPFQGSVEEGDGFGEVVGGFAEVGEGGREVVEDTGVPAGVFVGAEVGERGREGFPGAGEVGGGAGAAEEEGDVVEILCLLLFGRKGELRQ